MHWVHVLVLSKPDIAKRATKTAPLDWKLSAPMFEGTPSTQTSKETQTGYGCRTEHKPKFALGAELKWSSRYREII